MRENRFTFFIAIVLAILTSILAWNYYQDYTKSKKEEKEKAIFEKKINKDHISKIIIYNPNKMELSKQGDFWFVYPIYDIAYDYMIDNIISNIYQPSVSEVIDFDKNYYTQFFSNPINVYFLYSNNIYHLQRGIKNDFTNETYLWIDLPEFKNKIYIVNYWDLNYLDKQANEFRMKKVLNIDKKDVDKIVVNSNVIYKEEVIDKSVKRKKEEEEEEKYLWKLGDGTLVSKEYINSLFAVLNNYDFKYSIDSYNPGFVDRLSKVANIDIYSKGKRYVVDIFLYGSNEYVVRCSYRKPLLVYSKLEINDFLNKDIVEKKIFSYHIDSFDDFENVSISDSRAKFGFKKKDGKWYSPKNEEKTSQISLLFNTLKNVEYKQRFLVNPIATKYEIYTFDFVSKKGKKGKRVRFYLYNPDYLSYGKEIYKIEPFVFILKDLLK
ncbi:MAG: hypothetical protein NZM44_07595 [Candidatus Calescibacterium sp.]|nr:hypothetical protein [Candidatus Calescibacterium sp.]